MRSGAIAIIFGLLVSGHAFALDPETLRALWETQPSAEAVFELLGPEKTKLPVNAKESNSVAMALIPGLGHSSPQVRERVFADLRQFTRPGMQESFRPDFVKAISPYLDRPDLRASALELILNVSSAREAAEWVIAELRAPNATRESRRLAAERLPALRTRLVYRGQGATPQYFPGDMRARTRAGTVNNRRAINNARQARRERNRLRRSPDSPEMVRVVLRQLDETLAEMRHLADPVLRIRGYMDRVEEGKPSPSDRVAITELLAHERLLLDVRREAVKRLSEGEWADGQIAVNLIRALDREDNDDLRAEILYQVEMGGGAEVFGATSEDRADLEAFLDRLIEKPDTSEDARQVAKITLARLRPSNPNMTRYSDVLLDNVADVDLLRQRLEQDAKSVDTGAFRDGVISLLRHPQYRVRREVEAFLEKHLHADSDQLEPISAEQKARILNYGTSAYPVSFLALRYAGPEDKLSLASQGSLNDLEALARALILEPIPVEKEIPPVWKALRNLLARVASRDHDWQAREVLARLETQYPRPSDFEGSPDLRGSERTPARNAAAAVTGVPSPKDTMKNCPQAAALLRSRDSSFEIDDGSER